MRLLDTVFERRWNHLSELTARVTREVSHDPRETLARFLLCAPHTHWNDLARAYITGAAALPFFRDLAHETCGATKLSPDRGLCWERLRKVEMLFGEGETRTDTIAHQLSAAVNVIDQLAGPHIESLGGIPLFFTQPQRYARDLNCQGAALTIPVLYALSGGDPFSGLEFVEVQSTHRFAQCRALLEEILTHPAWDSFLAPEKQGPRYAEQRSVYYIPGADGTLGESVMVHVDFDVFHGGFLRERFVDLLRNHLFDLEYAHHIAVRNRQSGEVLDYPLERANYGLVRTFSLADGIALCALCAGTYVMCQCGGCDMRSLQRLYEELDGDGRFSRSIAFLGAYCHLLASLRERRQLRRGAADSERALVARIMDLFPNWESVPARWLLLHCVDDGRRDVYERVKAILVERYLDRGVMSKLAAQYFQDGRFFDRWEMHIRSLPHGWRARER